MITSQIEQIEMKICTGVIGGGRFGMGVKTTGDLGTEVLSGVQGHIPGSRSGGRSPPEAEEFLK